VLAAATIAQHHAAAQHREIIGRSSGDHLAAGRVLATFARDAQS